MPYEEELDKYIVNHLLNGNDCMGEFDMALNALREASEKIKKNKITSVKIKDDATFVTESDLMVEKNVDWWNCFLIYKW